jgi:hypothetical protein
MAFSHHWLVLLAEQIAAAQAAGDLDPGADPQQVAFELHAFMVLGNMQFVATSESAFLAQVRRAVDTRLAALAHPSAS